MTILVGADGSEPSNAAIRLATREAAWRDCPLRIVHAFVWPTLHVPDAQAGPGLREEAGKLLDEAKSIAETENAAVAVTTEIITGAPAPILLHEAQHAQLVVLGDRGLGGFTGLLVGSVAVQVSAHSPVPVLVARGDTGATSGPVVVGVDGSPASEPAVEWAFGEAAQRGAELIALHAWTGPVSTGPGDMLPLVYDAEAVQEDEARLLAEALSGHRERFPDVKVSAQAVHERPARALVRLSAQAQLLVVGSRGRGGFTGLLLGSVSQQALHHAHCPVLIVRRR